MTKEVLIEGRGVSAHTLAHDLADGGWDVLLTGQEYKVQRSWFVVGDRFPDDILSKIQSGEILSHTLTGCRFVIVDHETEEVRKDFTADTNGRLGGSACMMVDDYGIKQALKEKALSQSGVSVLDSNVAEINNGGKELGVTMQNGDKFRVQKVVDASGTGSKLLRKYTPEALKDDALTMWIYGFRAEGKFDPDIMLFPLKDKTTGRLAWVTPWSGDTADVLAADYCRVGDYDTLLKNGYFQEIYENMRDMCTGLDLFTVTKEVTNIRGRIRLVPLKDAPPNPNLYAVGDAAGQACPNMAEGVYPAIRNANDLALNLLKYPDYSSQRHYNDWRYSKKIEPYELSTVFLVDRFKNDVAGKNASVYEAIARSGDASRMLRLVSERKLSLDDIPELFRQGTEHPELLITAMSHLIRSQLIYRTPDNQRLLYGNGNGNGHK